MPVTITGLPDKSHLKIERISFGSRGDRPEKSFDQSQQISLHDTFVSYQQLAGYQVPAPQKKFKY